MKCQAKHFLIFQILSLRPPDVSLFQLSGSSLNLHSWLKVISFFLINILPWQILLQIVQKMRSLKWNYATCWSSEEIQTMAIQQLPCKDSTTPTGKRVRMLLAEYMTHSAARDDF